MLLTAYVPMKKVAATVHLWKIRVNYRVYVAVYLFLILLKIMHHWLPFTEIDKVIGLQFFRNRCQKLISTLLRRITENAALTPWPLSWICGIATERFVLSGGERQD